MRDSQFDFSDTSRTQKYFVAMEFWTEFLATSSSGSEFLVGELGGVAGVTAIHLLRHGEDSATATTTGIGHRYKPRINRAQV